MPPISNNMLHNLELRLMPLSQGFPLLPRNLLKEEEEEAIEEIQEVIEEAVVVEAGEPLDPIINRHHHLHLHHQTYYRMAIQNIGHPHQLKKLGAFMSTMVGHAVPIVVYVVMVSPAAATNVKTPKMAKIGTFTPREANSSQRRPILIGTSPIRGSKLQQQPQQ